MIASNRPILFFRKIFSTTLNYNINNINKTSPFKSKQYNREVPKNFDQP